jgi:histidine ammonia-lyase
METSSGQEDVQSFSWEAVDGLGEAIRLTREVAACELLAVQQAFALSKRATPPGLQEFLAAVAAVVPPIEVDRPFGVDVGHLADLLARWTPRVTSAESPGPNRLEPPASG